MPQEDATTLDSRALRSPEPSSRRASAALTSSRCLAGRSPRVALWDRPASIFVNGERHGRRPIVARPCQLECQDQAQGSIVQKVKRESEGTVYWQMPERLCATPASDEFAPERLSRLPSPRARAVSSPLFGSRWATSSLSCELMARRFLFGARVGHLLHCRCNRVSARLRVGGRCRKRTRRLRRTCQTQVRPPRSCVTWSCLLPVFARPAPLAIISRAPSRSQEAGTSGGIGVAG